MQGVQEPLKRHMEQHIQMENYNKTQMNNVLERPKVQSVKAPLKPHTEQHLKMEDYNKTQMNKASEGGIVDPAHTNKKKEERNMFEEHLEELKHREKEAYADIAKKWHDKPRGFEMVSEGYLNQQKRLLPFLVLHPQRVSASFLDAAKKMEWAKTTVLSYFITLIAAAKALEIILPDAAVVIRNLKREATTHIPVRQTCVWQEVCQWAALLPLNLATAITLAFQIGHRIGDILLLHWSDVVAEQKRILITVRRGKTVSLGSSYCISVPIESEAAVLIVAAMRSKVKGYLGPFVDDPHQAKKIIGEVIGRDIRCLRRGGLQHMASTGCTPADLLLFSRHASVAMLHRYLHEGRDLVFETCRMEELIRRAF
ncbi:MAG: hypothetical protein COA68_12240 [Oceanobacter sp.]|nr:MAG: hypothetical protein COA68_12240 [Oceanobacter sp.]